MTLTAELHCTIAETSLLNKATEKLYVSQPSLTDARLKNWKKELGITIFYRSRAGVTLTNDRRSFLLYAEAKYGQYEAILENIW